ncbi:hypothetical protein K2173_017441 [Erythroxylum novogranatense]|uniref:Uncharacterized protein n=1 Tax=Erythroxylum novogranatense TaxID=1862640 RepID=A0AAV8TKH9_9ROSI|nr:hypothetical protein K2173_017441 [Erythroxylum novogranatense]
MFFSRESGQTKEKEGKKIETLIALDVDEARLDYRNKRRKKYRKKTDYQARMRKKQTKCLKEKANQTTEKEKTETTEEEENRRRSACSVEPNTELVSPAIKGGVAVSIFASADWRLNTSVVSGRGFGEREFDKSVDCIATVANE